jgi:hypothetical protein
MSVYLMQPTNGGIIKIGHALDVAGRAVTLGKMFPYGVELICAFPGGLLHEHFMHHCFAPVRLSASRGEWYRNCLPIWRLVADVAAEGGPKWLPRIGPEFNSEDLAIERFGGRKEALEACGYSASTTFADAFGYAGGRSHGVSRMLFVMALQDGDLPASAAPIPQHSDLEA